MCMTMISGPPLMKPALGAQIQLDVPVGDADAVATDVDREVVALNVVGA